MSVIAAVQMNSGDRVESNLKVVADLVQEARNLGASVVVLPECFALMPKDSHQRISASEALDGSGEIEKFLSNLAKEIDIWIVSGGMLGQASQAGMVRNSCLVHDCTGTRVARYDKIHLFDVVLKNGEQYCESEYTESGKELVLQKTPAGVAGLTICYDVRFPEMYRQLASSGAQWFPVPSAFAATTGKVHWEILLRARAIENLAYVVAPAQYGTHSNGRNTYGHTMIVDPWGNVMASKEYGEGVVVAEVDLVELARLRKTFASFQLNSTSDDEGATLNYASTNRI